MGERKKLPVGIENFPKLREEDFYYVDKSGLIEMLLNNWGEVNLFTRPRRFGKSLNMSMLRHFFEIGTDPSLFDGLSIAEQILLFLTVSPLPKIRRYVRSTWVSIRSCLSA